MKILPALLIAGGLGLTASFCSAQQASKTMATSPTAPVTVQTIEQSIAKIGGKATLKKFFCGADNTGLNPSYAFKQVISGSKQWVDLAMKLYKYGDAGCSEALNDALGAAMQKQPRNVLPYVGKSSGLGPEYVCLPMLPEDMPDAEALRNVRLTKAALMRVSDKALDQPCKACLKEVNRVEKVLLADMAKKK